MDKRDCIQLGRFFKLEKEKKGVKLEYDSINGGTIHLDKDDMEQVRDWLDRALKPRYEVINPCSITCLVYDIENDESIAAFHKRDCYNAELEARKLCKQLNETFRKSFIKKGW